MSTDILVDIEDLHFNYDGRPVLQGINMKIPRGKVVAIMGGSGCGKTTLLRCIGGQLRPTGGRVRLEKHQVCEMSESELYRLRRKMGMLFQFGALFTDMNVFENVAFPMREHTDLGDEMIRDLVLMKLEAVGLRGAHRLMPAELSGGMARRVALARAVALDPMLVMYDEPFTGLDPIALGVHRCALAGHTATSLPTYISRPHDQALLELIEKTRHDHLPRLLLVVGGSCTGKSRAAFEAISVAAPEWSSCGSARRP